MKKIMIDPVTRLEGHGKIAIFLKDDGSVANVYFQVPELRGFEKFSEGRAAGDGGLNVGACTRARGDEEARVYHRQAPAAAARHR